ncbi:hypothetical protein [Actinomadura montaniterrae]|uniref:Uncharacterized protein n=1 Tax=Actinomadura montaniterrae TaxID=1803903 RepID=A0A6L3WAC1_9ACTN|nr:hypothetical protein [Actinomadura montaniterrae]KAB2388860.1 hypothetical protein F9B16_02800 [Actinomadura montaniterrae]
MGSGKPAPKARARIGGWGAAALITLALAATLLGSGQIGHATEASDGSAWLWSRTAGEVARVNPDSGQVEQRRGVTDVPAAIGCRSPRTTSIYSFRIWTPAGCPPST